MYCEHSSHKFQLQQAGIARYVSANPLHSVFTDATFVELGTFTSGAALIFFGAMQALRCLLRSRQGLGCWSISAALQNTAALSFAALQAPEKISSQIHSGNTAHSLHEHASSSTTLPKHPYRFALSKLQGCAHSSFKGASTGELPSFPSACKARFKRWPCLVLSCRQFCAVEAVLQ